MTQPAKIQVRFSDLDILGHVNNTIYFGYFEMTRIHYFREMLGDHWNYQKYGFVLAKNEVEYILPIFLHHEPIVEMNCIHIGLKSFTLSYVLLVDGKVHATGKSIQVCFDATNNTTIEIPEKMKNGLQLLYKTK
jgi:acyl-CoA thioester hydrolase